VGWSHPLLIKPTMQNCFDKIIGFTKTDCACFAGSGLEDYKDSNSGLFMDELEETSQILSAVKGTADCGKSMGDAFRTARDNAIIDFNEQILMELGTRYTVRQMPYFGLLGQRAYSAPLALASSFIGTVYEMRPLKGAIMTVKKVSIALNQSIPVILKVYKAYIIGQEYQLQEEVIATITGNSVANQLVDLVLPEPLRLPFTDDSSHFIQYLFIIDRSAGFQPMDTKGSCGCDGQKRADSWLIAGSIEGDDIDHLRTATLRTGKTAYSNGIVLDVDIKCSDTGFVCENYFGNPFLKTAIDHAVLYQAASNLLQNILRSNAINRFALTKREQMATDAAILHNRFKSRVKWISENIDMKGNTCYVCNQVNEINAPYRTGIRF
jgi:hypothetical protein